MATPKPKTHIDLPLARGLPASHAARLGRIIMRCTQVEHHFLLVTKRLLGIGIAEARILFANGRWSDQMQRMADIARLRDFDLGISNFKAFLSSLEKTEGRRNLLAHSPFRVDGRKLVLFSTKSRYTPPGQTERVTRAEAPERHVVDVAYLEETSAWLDSHLQELRRIEKLSRTLLKPPA